MCANARRLLPPAPGARHVEPSDAAFGLLGTVRGLVVTPSRRVPGGAAVRRADAERQANPERLNLDRLELTACPELHGEAHLRLLNLQHNGIREVTNLEGLRNLIFLDLYNNDVQRLSGFEAVPTLRVLMLGKNRVSRIEGLAGVPALDVLDLHSNSISVMEGLDALRDLRVLNLAGAFWFFAQPPGLIVCMHVCFCLFVPRNVRCNCVNLSG
jgi:hypothetical protein